MDGRRMWVRAGEKLGEEGEWGGKKVGGKQCTD